MSGWGLLLAVIRNVAVVVGILVAAAVLFPPPSAAQDPADTDFLIRPGSGSSMSSEGDYFVIKTKPGKVLEQSVVLRNDSNRTLALQLGGVDAVTGPLGGTSYGLPTEEAALTGSWISMDTTQVSLRPGGVEEIPFEVRVPSDAATGQHLAGIAAYVPNENEDDDVVPGEPGAVVTVQTRRVVSVLIELPGSAAPELVVSGVEPDARTDAIYLGIAITNEGFGLTEGQGVIELPEHGFRRTFDVGTFVPGTSITYPIEWQESPSEGEYPARVEISYDGGVGRWEGTLVIGEAVSEKLAQSRGTSDGTMVWIAAGIGLILVLGLVGTIIWRRRAPRPSRAGSGTKKVDQPAHRRAATTEAGPAPVQPRYPTTGPPPPPPPRPPGAA